MLFPNRLRQLRMASGMKQREIAKSIGVDIPMYCRYEHGERNPKREQVVKLAKLFKTDPDELVALWLAFAAINHIGNDKCANQALQYLKTELNEGDDAVAAPAPQPVQITIDAPKPARRDIVAKLGKSPYPQYHEGDALELMAAVEDESIDCIITCPPYWCLKSGGEQGVKDITPQEFAAYVIAVMNEAHRALKPGGSLWLDLADARQDNNGQLALPWRIVMPLLDQQNWLLQNDVVWNRQQEFFKPDEKRLRENHEYIFHLVKQPKFYYDDNSLRINYINATAQSRLKGKTASGVTGSRYRVNIMKSEFLSDNQKKMAIAQLDDAIRRVDRGEITDFRLYLKESAAMVEPGDDPIRAENINNNGFHISTRSALMPPDVWDILPEKSKYTNFPTFPKELCRIIILATCPKNGIVLDPFCGTGTACEVAQDLNRRSIGFDINADLLRQARAKIKPETLSLF